MVRLYKFVPDDHALDNIKNKHVKVSLANELNDVFEFRSIQLPNKQQRDVWDKALDGLWSDKGIICFCRNWGSPLMWAHYCQNHRGLCLGYDVDETIVSRVKYRAYRRKIDFDKLPPEERLNAIGEFAISKFSHWRYEEEFRALLSLTECNYANGLYFLPLGERILLREVIIGVSSKITTPQIQKIHGFSADIITARPAFRSFRIVRQKLRSKQK